ncbi:MAG: GNAT family N-acetyltransferase [Candidatus Sericytochromatia bacterium]
MLEIKIIPITNENKKYFNKFESNFIIDGFCDLYIENKIIKYNIIKTEPKIKKYPEEELKIDKYIDSEDKIVYFAFYHNEIVGQIVFSKSWNNYGYIEDIRVNNNFRKMGIGKLLINKAKEWAIDKNYLGLSLETQNNNTEACKFYEKCGFEIGGFDKYLYKNTPNLSNEIAIYWYWFR